MRKRSTLLGLEAKAHFSQDDQKPSQHRAGKWVSGIWGKPQGGQFISVNFRGADCFSLSHWLWSLAQLALPLLAALSAGKAAAAAAEPTERSRGAQPDSLC